VIVATVLLACRRGITMAIVVALNHASRARLAWRPVFVERG
jgi:hypothetical protein